MTSKPAAPTFLSPYFLGAYAENDQLLERLLLQFVRDHVYWRRNFHPKDQPPIPTSVQFQPFYLDFVAKLDQELHLLSADLKQAVPLFHPRYLGHMASDVLLAGLLAQMITSLYNPNNVCEDVAPSTVQKEIDAIRQLAQMFGMPVDIDYGAWGFLTSGGTLANFSSLRNCTAIKYYPLALAEAGKMIGISFPRIGPQAKALCDYSAWELLNLTVEEVIHLRKSCLDEVRKNGSAEQFYQFVQVIRAERIEALGLRSFFKKHTDISPPKVLVSASAHYSWEKGMKLTGLGTANLTKITVDDHMRMDMEHLIEVLDHCLRERIPVLELVGALGTTEFGTVDPIQNILEQRDQCLNKGLYFPVHIDAAWGGYLTSMFRESDGSLVPKSQLRKEFRYFPSDLVYGAFSSLDSVDSITVDPHKLGYIPYPAGAYINRHRGVIEFIVQDAPYVFDVQEEPSPQDLLHQLGQYILEGSKPGSAAAAVYVSQQVLPLDRKGFGRLLGQTIHAAEYFYDMLCDLRDQLDYLVQLSMPFPTDSNILCLCVNPKVNHDLAATNRFMRELFSAMKVTPNRPIQTKEYFASYTSLHKEKISHQQSGRILKALDIDPSTFRSVVESSNREADHLFLLRHTLMNPWLLFTDDEGQNTLDHYISFLENRIINLCQTESWRSVYQKE